MHILLTDAGREYAREFLGFLYRAEEKAIRRTIAEYSEEFIEAMEVFGANLKEAFEEELLTKEEKSLMHNDRAQRYRKSG